MESDKIEDALLYARCVCEIVLRGNDATFDAKIALEKIETALLEMAP